MRLVSCDHCGTTQREDALLVRPAEGEISLTFGHPKIMFKSDLCEPCFDKFRLTIRKFLSEQGEPSGG